MPFGKHKGKPISDLPPAYVEWLRGVDIRDERLRAILAASQTDGAPANVVAMAAVRRPKDNLPSLVAEFLQARERAGEVKRELMAIRERLLPLLKNNGGSYVDQINGQRLSVEERHRWEYDPTALHQLVEEGLLDEAAFAECLKTNVDKAVVAGWIEQRKLTPEQIAGTNSSVVTKVLQQLLVKPVGR